MNPDPGRFYAFTALEKPGNLQLGDKICNRITKVALINKTVLVQSVEYSLENFGVHIFSKNCSKTEVSRVMVREDCDYSS